MNAQEVMEAAYNQQENPKTFSFMLQYYVKTLGYLVDMIDGILETTIVPYYYRDFKIGGDDSKKGIDHTKISDGQTITFTYQQYDAEQHAGTLIIKKHAIKTGK